MHAPITPALPQNQPAVRAEVTGSDRCSALGIEVRGAVLCLRIRSIGEGAALTVDERRTAFVRWKPFPHAAVSPRNRVRQGVL